MRYLTVLVLMACGGEVMDVPDAGPDPATADWSGTYSLAYGFPTSGSCGSVEYLDTSVTVTAIAGGRYSATFHPSEVTAEGDWRTWMNYTVPIATTLEIDVYAQPCRDDDVGVLAACSAGIVVQDGNVVSFVATADLEGGSCFAYGMPITATRI